MAPERPLWHPTGLPFALVVAAGASLWIAYSGFLGESHADSIIPSLVSLLGWTPMYWGQDRFGMLVPLLTLPFDSPFLVISLQLALSAFGCLATFVLLCRWVSPGGAGTLAALLCGASVLVLMPPGIRHEMLAPSQPYGVSLALLFGALTVVRDERSRARWAVAAFLTLLSFWVTIGSAIFAVVILSLQGGLELWRRRPTRSMARWREWVLPFAPMAGAVALAVLMWALARVIAPRSTIVGALPIAQYLGSWGRWLSEMWVATAPHDWPLAVLGAAVVAAVWILVPAARRTLGTASQLAVLLVLAAILYWLFFGRMRWIAMNDYNFRYAIPSAMLLQGAVVALALAPLRRWRLQGALPVAGALLLLFACYQAVGLPSPARARQALDRHGRYTEELLSLRATHFIGDYWVVWPGVLHAHLVAYERGQPLWLYGISDRAVATRPAWVAPPAGEWRIAAVPGDTTVERWVDYGRLGALERVGSGAALELLRPVEPPAR